MAKRLLVCAQAVDAADPQLSFFILWLKELAKHYQGLTVICLRQGGYELPQHVRVFALGGGRLARAYKLIAGAWRFRNNYDAVLVHQGQEFALVAGWLWKLLGKPVYMWRNHYAGSWLTDMAAAFCTKVFATSAHSYTARYKKTELMPVGIDTDMFAPPAGAARKPRSVLFLARMAKSKRPEMLLEALALLKQEGIDFSATLVGSPLAKDRGYYESLKKSAEGLGSSVAFVPGVPNAQTPVLYSAHAVFVNCSRSGMYDKTIFEAAACGCAVLAASDDWRALAGEAYHFNDAGEFVRKLKGALESPTGALRPLAERQSLAVLMERLAATMV